MSMSTGGASVAITEVRGGLVTRHFVSMDEAILAILTSQGIDGFERFKREILPKAEAAWAADEVEETSGPASPRPPGPPDPPIPPCPFCKQPFDAHGASGQCPDGSGNRYPHPVA